MVLRLVADPLEFPSVVLLAPPISFYVVSIVSHPPFWISHHLVKKISDLGQF